MRHDPEKAAASYLGGTMSARRRHVFERHMVECEDCWEEVQLGQRGRSLAEAARELAPQEMRERLRVTVAAISRPRRRWTPRFGGAVLAALIAVAVLSVVMLQERNAQPEVIDAVLTDFRDPTPLGPAARAALPSKLGDLTYHSSYKGEVAGVTVTVHTYVDAAGDKVMVYQAPTEFPVAAGAEQSGDGRTWTASADGVVLFCADHPTPALVVGDDAPDVTLAATELGLR